MGPLRDRGPTRPRSKLGRTALIGVPVVLGVALVGLLVAAQVADDVTGCGSVDPTDPANYSAVTIINDTLRPVVVDACTGGYCVVGQLPQDLAPGDRYSDDAGCGVTGADMTSWRVRTTSGTLLGYIAVQSPRSQDLQFDVSQASPDRDTPTPHT